MPKFEVGDRVTRKVDVFATASPLLHGRVIRRYGKSWYRPKGSEGRDWPIGYDPEIYDVEWDDGRVHRGFFPHGLDKEY